MTQNHQFEMQKVDELDMFEILKPELAKALGKCEEENVDINSIKLQMRHSWERKELDGKVYQAKCLYITFSSNYYGLFKYCYVIKLTPFNCFICGEGKHMRGLKQGEYLDIRDKNLTKFYRRKMQELYGKNWRDAFDEYIARIKKLKKDILDEAYNESLKEIEDTITEEQTF